MMTIHNRRAVIFDMDGTLIDSELHTEEAVLALLTEHKIEAGDLNCQQFYGITWRAISERLVELFPGLRSHCSPELLQRLFYRLGRESPPPLIQGAREALVQASALLPTAIGTSGNRESVLELLSRFKLDDVLHGYVCAEDYTHSKPNPECYLLAAERLGVAPQDCLVFEDSIPGLRAAKAAGMQTVAITHRSPDEALARELADYAVAHYELLPPDFFRSITASGQE